MRCYEFYRLDGAYSEVGDGDTAFAGGRSPRYAVIIVGLAWTADVLPAERGWVRTLWDALRPHALGAGGYINAEAEHDSDRVLSSYGSARYGRLAQIKAAYDPKNVLHRNANIRPAHREGGGP